MPGIITREPVVEVTYQDRVNMEAPHWLRVITLLDDIRMVAVEDGDTHSAGVLAKTMHTLLDVLRVAGQMSDDAILEGINAVVAEWFPEGGK